MLGIALIAVGCRGDHNGATLRGSGLGSEQTTDRGSSSARNSSSAAEHAEHDCRSHAVPPAPPPPGFAATALHLKDLAAVDSVRVSAHVGGVTLRKRDGVWRTSGKRGCVVPPSRVTQALSNLTQLTVEGRRESWPSDAPFELQVDVLVGQDPLIHFEVGQRKGNTDLVQLLNGDVIELRGLDRQQWSVEPAAWCLGPN